MYKTTSRRERKKQETRQRLLECAWQLFQEGGYDDTTVEDITEAADVAKGTFFNYFPTKEALLDELALWRIDLLGGHVLAAEVLAQIGRQVGVAEVRPVGIVGVHAVDAAEGIVHCGVQRAGTDQRAERGHRPRQLKPGAPSAGCPVELFLQGVVQLYRIPRQARSLVELA